MLTGVETISMLLQFDGATAVARVVVVVGLVFLETVCGRDE